MAQYTDIYVRDSLTDTGVFPSAGDAYRSPDIIPLQKGTLTAAQAATTYGQDQGLAIVNSQVNNIYVRAKNLQPTGTEPGTVQVYRASAGLFLQPSLWNQNALTTPGGSVTATFLDANNSSNLSPQAVGLSNPPFQIAAFPSPTLHWCLIAVVTTPKTTVVIPPTFPSSAAFASWVQQTPAVAWRNLVIVPSTTTQIVKTATFGNLDTSPSQMYFRMVATGLPAGTTVNALSTDALCPINQTVTLPAPTAPGGQQITGFESIVPATYSTGVLTLTITPPTGRPFAPGGTLDVSYYAIPPEEPSELELSVMRDELHVVEQDGEHAAQTTALIHLGQINVQLTSGS